MMIMDANTIRFNIAIGIPSIKFIQTKNVSKSKAFRWSDSRIFRSTYLKIYESKWYVKRLRIKWKKAKIKHGHIINIYLHKNANVKLTLFGFSLNVILMEDSFVLSRKSPILIYTKKYRRNIIAFTHFSGYIIL